MGKEEGRNVYIRQCGCAVTTTDKGICLGVQECPLHEASGDMYEALKRIQPTLDINDSTGWKGKVIREALSKAEGA